MKVFSLASDAIDIPEWQALSYEWGKNAARKHIEVNGHLFCVRPNLHGFLRQLVREHYASWIYIDAICINQDDIVEREEQVALMRDIYHGAEVVIAWIDHNQSPEVQDLRRKVSVMENARSVVESHNVIMNQLPNLHGIFAAAEVSTRIKMESWHGFVKSIEEASAISPILRVILGKASHETQNLIARKVIEDYALAGNMVDKTLADQGGMRLHSLDYIQKVVSCWIDLLNGKSAAEIQNSLKPGPNWNFLSFVILGNTYWTRLWVVQEILVARRFVVRVGSETMNPADLCTILDETDNSFLQSLSTRREVNYQLYLKKVWIEVNSR